MVSLAHAVECCPLMLVVGQNYVHDKLDKTHKHTQGWLQTLSVCLSAVCCYKYHGVYVCMCCRLTEISHSAIALTNPTWRSEACLWASSARCH